jgi:hypothetical protein
MFKQVVRTFLLLALAVAGCKAKESMLEGAPSGQTTAGTNGSSSGAGTGEMPDEPGGGESGTSASGAGNGSMEPGMTAGTGSADPPDGGRPPPHMPDPEVMEQLDPNVDWTALQIVYPRMYSAYDGVHTFNVPVFVDGVEIELSGWSAIPASAVQFDADPETGGAMITVLEGVEEITIAAAAGPIGGTAPLFITTATPEDWERGLARYDNMVDYDLPMLSFVDLINPNWVPPEPPDNLSCKNCHSDGAKYFQIQHTPSQAARISDDELIQILTTGTKPAGIGYSVLPEAFQHLYVGFHTWEASEQDMIGLIVYMRSLTPTAQGDIVVPGQITGTPMMP